MTYYHLRYNIYEEPGFAVEKERWVTFDSTRNDHEVKEFLESEHQNVVSIIMSKLICLEEFELSQKRIP
jgi:hypothetical protein